MSIILQAIAKAFREAKLPNYRLLYPSLYPGLFTGKIRRTAQYIGVWPIHTQVDKYTPFLAVIQHEIQNVRPPLHIRAAIVSGEFHCDQERIYLISYLDIWRNRDSSIIPRCAIRSYYTADPDLFQKLLLGIATLRAQVPVGLSTPRLPERWGRILCTPYCSLVCQVPCCLKRCAI